jgi:hypothetical protein
VHDQSRPGRQQRVQRGPSVTQSFAVNKLSQTITFANLANRPPNRAPFVVSATASSTLTVTFTTTTPAVCTSSGTNGATITLVGSGTCLVEADRAGNTTYNAAPSVIRSFTASKVNQTITFGVLNNKTLADSSVTVSATASSGLTVTFSTTTPSVCTWGGANGETITLLAAGKCTVRADQAGNGVYNAAPSVNQSFTLSKVPQTISFAALPNRSKSTPVAIQPHRDGDFGSRGHLHEQHEQQVHGVGDDGHPRQHRHLHDRRSPARQQLLGRRA